MVHIPTKSTLATISLILVKKVLQLQKSTCPENTGLHVRLVVSSQDVDMEEVNLREPAADTSAMLDIEMETEDVNTNEKDLDGDDGTEDVDEDSEKSETSKKRHAVEKRQSMRVKRLQTEKEDESTEEERELESLEELNDILPKRFQFRDEKTSFPTVMVDLGKLLNQIQEDIQLKSAFSKEEKDGVNQKQYSIQYDNWETNTRHPFFDSTSLAESFLKPRLGKTISIGMLLIEIVLFAIKHTAEHPHWTIRVSYIMCTILQLHTYFCDPMKTLFDVMHVLTDDETAIEVILFLAEMLLDSLTDQAGKELLPDHDSELFGANENPMLKTSRKNILDKALNSILGYMNASLPKIDHLIRCKWLFAKYEETFGTPRSTVDALLDCFELFSGSDEARQIVLISCNRDNIIDLPSITTKIKYQQLRLKIDETEYLANDFQYFVVAERLEPLFLSQDTESVLGQDIVAEMPHQKRLNLLKLLNLVLAVNLVSQTSWEGKIPI
jgi:hypothetical protein